MIVWLASYPRSGNTYLRLILHHGFGLKTYSIYGDVHDIGSHAPTREVVGHELLPPGWTPEKAREEEQTWCVKTHELPTDDSKAIYVIRDGREALVSYFHYLHKYTEHPASIVDVIAGAVRFGLWSDHVATWNPLERPDTLLLRFEEFVSNAAGHAPRIAEFLQREPVETTFPRFEELKQMNPVFFRSGQRDSWKRSLNEQQQHLFWLLHRTSMKRYSYARDGAELVSVDSGFGATVREAIDARVNRLQSEMTRLETQKRSQEDRISHQHKELELQREQIEEQRRIIEEQRRIIEGLELRAGGQREQIDQLEAKVRQMIKSWSWKLTRPLRQVRGLFVRKD